MGDHGRAVFLADVEHQAVAVDAQMQRVGAGLVPNGCERVLFEQVIDRDLALVLDVGIGTADRFLVENHGGKAPLRSCRR